MEKIDPADIVDAFIETARKVTWNGDWSRGLYLLIDVADVPCSGGVSWFPEIDDWIVEHDDDPEVFPVALVIASSRREKRE